MVGGGNFTVLHFSLYVVDLDWYSFAVLFLCSKEKVYELKMLENSNTFLLLENQNKNKSLIVLSACHSIETLDYSPKKYFLLNLLKDNCSLYYNTETGENNIAKFKLKLTKNE